MYLSKYLLYEVWAALETHLEYKFFALVLKTPVAVEEKSAHGRKKMMYTCELDVCHVTKSLNFLSLEMREKQHRNKQKRGIIWLS